MEVVESKSWSPLEGSQISPEISVSLAENVGVSELTELHQRPEFPFTTIGVRVFSDLWKYTPYLRFIYPGKDVNESRGFTSSISFQLGIKTIKVTSIKTAIGEASILKEGAASNVELQLQEPWQFDRDSFVKIHGDEQGLPQHAVEGRPLIITWVEGSAPCDGVSGTHQPITF
nr:hypothetical protein [Tanacetum cinerariifolium]